MRKVTLGPNSPLLTKSGRARSLCATEFPVQAGIVQAIVGPIGPEGRRPGCGITQRFPEAGLLYAIPNGASASSKAAAGKRKAEGQLKDMLDLCLPVARCGYHALYMEVKRPGINSARKGQRQMARALREEGNAVVTVNDVQAGFDIIWSYLNRDERTFEKLHATYYAVGI
jgi:hypothetical protein